MNTPKVIVWTTNARKIAQRGMEKNCKNGTKCRFNNQNKCEFKHDPESQWENSERKKYRTH